MTDHGKGNLNPLKRGLKELVAMLRVRKTLGVAVPPTMAGDPAREQAWAAGATVMAQRVADRIAEVEEAALDELREQAAAHRIAARICEGIEPFQAALEELRAAREVPEPERAHLAMVQ